ncbi:MAG: methyltransferase domain-containing protein [Bryobacteraceae bacterium]
MRGLVRQAYSESVRFPQGKHPFPIGRDFAISVGYPPELLADLPRASVEAYAGVSNLSLSAPIGTNDRVLDLGCGAGLDSLIAGRRVGPAGSVVGLDFSATAVVSAREAAARTGMDNVLFCCGEAEKLPMSEGSFDLALVNGIFNLNPERAAIFQELARVLRPGGVVFAAELVLSRRISPRPWTAADWFA